MAIRMRVLDFAPATPQPLQPPQPRFHAVATDRGARERETVTGSGDASYRIVCMYVPTVTNVQTRAEQQQSWLAEKAKTLHRYFQVPTYAADFNLFVPLPMQR